ncbi:hypothetical protein [Lactobacillus gigeriorum]|uniref:Uncharacterized protein n=1 Tax=Lactobacillus gigeriorum DSM 23908 = CRBIP 24.85 TaxID=1423751 RepID=I7KNW9_9LACO|nr:hypothetical protein [Lactobacillus gigeriorum]KRN12023.1 hypothetical protein FC38_GL000429 [Lactobacillus gigeriorum DSM 23908 = CRBIP 24.85]CCI86959.1 Putative uncharacterized protein orf58 [Lactobacillus gigeriorum DSM 23908 = CRBIP 24.85]
MFRNLIKNSWYSIIGLGMVLIGSTLWGDEHHFFYPPQYAGIMNADWIDAIAVFLGIGLIVLAFVDSSNKALAGMILSCSAGFISLITLVEIFHMWFAGVFRFDVPIAYGLIFLLVIMNVAKNGKK